MLECLASRTSNDKCLPFWRENIFIKATDTSYVHPQKFLAQVREQGTSPPTPLPGLAAHRCIKNQVIKHKETKSQSIKRSLPPGLIQASHSSSYCDVDLPNPERITDTSATPSGMQWPDDRWPHCHALTGSSSENNPLWEFGQLALPKSKWD